MLIVPAPFKYIPFSLLKITFTFCLLRASIYPSICDLFAPLTWSRIRFAAWFGPRFGFALMIPARWLLPMLSALLRTCPSRPTLYSKNSLILTPRPFGVEILTTGTPFWALSRLVLYLELGSTWSPSARMLKLNTFRRSTAVNLRNILLFSFIHSSPFDIFTDYNLKFFIISILSYYLKTYFQRATKIHFLLLRA